MLDHDVHIIINLHRNSIWCSLCVENPCYLDFYSRFLVLGPFILYFTSERGGVPKNVQKGMQKHIGGGGSSKNVHMLM